MYIFAELELTQCTFVNNIPRHTEGIYLEQTYAAIRDCNFTGNNARRGFVYLGRGTSASLYNSSFSHNENVALQINGAYSVINIVYCVFMANGDFGVKDPYLAFYLQYGAVKISSSYEVHITNCSFIKNIAKEGGAISMHKAEVYIRGSIFIGNRAYLYGGAVHTDTASGHIYDSLFMKNSAPIGGAIYSKGDLVIFVNCSFQTNHADKFGGVAEIVVGMTVIHNSNCASNSAGNDGGLITLNNTIKHNLITFLISGSTFSENLAPNGVLSLGYNADVTIIHSQFVYERMLKKHSSYKWSTLFVSYGNMTFTGVDIIIAIDIPIQHLSVITHYLPGKVLINDIHIKCPFQYKPVIHSSSGLDTYEPLSDLNIACSTECETGYAIHDSGFFQISRGKNGSEYIFNQNQICQPCPYGGDCHSGGITEKPNYWGVRNGSELIFYHCHPTMCLSCSSLECSDPTYSQCAANREGPMCTLCTPGYTEALFSSLCISNVVCKDYWIYLIFLMASLIYSIILIFHKDISEYFIAHSIHQSDKQDVYKTDFLIMVFYYFQDSALLHVSTPYTITETDVVSSLKKILSLDCLSSSYMSFI